MAWLLLGVDSLIACIAVGPIMQRRMSLLLPFALLFGIGDGGGFLLGSALHWASAGEQALSSVLQAGIGLAIGIGIAYSIPALRRRMWLANATAGAP
jgi:hypothetical protein